MEHPLMSMSKMSEKIEPVQHVTPVPPVIPFISPPAATPTPNTDTPSVPQTPAGISDSSEVATERQDNKAIETSQVLSSTPDAEINRPVQVQNEPSRAEIPVPTETEGKSATEPLLCEPTPQTAVVEQNSTSTTPAANSTTETAPIPVTTANKAIKITLKRKEGGDSYSINSFSAPGSQITGTMRSLKIKAKITSGEQAGTSTDVEVQPVVHTVPIPNESEENPTVCEDVRAVEGVAPPSAAVQNAEDIITSAKFEVTGPKPKRLVI
jgi:hypothetical protein